MIPTEDESQQAINQLIDLVLDVSKGIAWSWEYSHDSTKIKGKSLLACTLMEKKPDRQVDRNVIVNKVVNL